MEHIILFSAIGVFVAMVAAALVISYQHEKIREKIVERAQAMGCSDVKKLEAALDEMLGPAIRSFCAASDEEFQRRLGEIVPE